MMMNFICFLELCLLFCSHSHLAQIVPMNPKLYQYRDLMVARGAYPKPLQSGLVPISNGAGEIVGLGSDVQNFTIGDCVVANFAIDGYLFSDLEAEVDGVLMQFKIFPADVCGMHLCYAEALSLPCADLTAYTVLTGPILVKGGDFLLVQGTGSIAPFWQPLLTEMYRFALQLTLASGVTVFVTSSLGEKLEAVERHGIPKENLINYTRTPAWEAEGVDHDAIQLGGAASVAKSLQCAAFNGWIHLTGFISHDKNDLSHLPQAAIMRALFLRGVVTGDRKTFDSLNKVIASAKIHPLIDKVFPFEEAQQAYEYIQAQKHVGKFVIQVA
ncbi:hypothetical protein C8J56DRAFT_1004595 [Mycena floridula]|nr:hypothetical protein C8J56DRAFT_1004595 [Mycena floridula]